MPHRLPPDHSVEARHLAVEIADAADYGDGFTLQHHGASVLVLAGDWQDWTSDGTTPIADGSYEGQELLVSLAIGQFGHNDNPFIIQDAGNVNLHGDFKFGVHDYVGPAWLRLQWDGSAWREVARNNVSDQSGGALNFSGRFAHGEGDASAATGEVSHAEGNSTASGDYSHAEGGSSASAPYSHAEGTSTASGDRSHAEGNRTEASGYAAHAEGDGAKADKYAQHAHASGASWLGQVSRLVAWGDTNDGTKTNLCLDGTDDVIAMPSGYMAWNVRVEVVANKAGGGFACARWNLEALLLNDGAEYGGDLYYSGPSGDQAPDDTLTGGSSGGATPGNWRVELSADAEHSALAIKVTGEAGHTIHWVARVELVEAI